MSNQRSSKRTIQHWITNINLGCFFYNCGDVYDRLVNDYDELFDHGGRVHVDVGDRYVCDDD